MTWVVAALFLLITILLLSGKGAFLIAGYNTASEEKKKKYDEKKLCRVMGCGMAGITCFVVILSCFGDEPPEWLITCSFIGIIGITIGMLILCNTRCKAENSEEIEVAKSAKRKYTKLQKGVLAFGIIVALGVGVMLSTGQITATLKGGEVEIKGAYWKKLEIPITSIETISYTDHLDTGKRVNGMNSFKLLEGSFRNQEFGAYTLYAYKDCNSYITLHTSEGVVVVNDRTADKTKILYEKIEAAVKSLERSNK